MHLLSARQRSIKTNLFALIAITFITIAPLSSASADDSSKNATVQSAQKQDKTLLEKFNEKMLGLLFFDISGGSIVVDQVDRAGNPIKDDNGEIKKKTVEVPFLVMFLLAGGIFFTFWHRWINIRLFRHAIDVVKGKFDKDGDHGEISHFRALTSALSATVGLGNIAGVAIAVQTGGPGAVFWMIITAIFGMSSKFNSCTLAQMYRQVNPDGSISGGPMYYLDLGLRNKGKLLGYLGKILAVLYALMIMGGSIGGGNMFQANQTTEAFMSTFNLAPGSEMIIGLIMAFFVAIVILGGIKRIGLATSRIVPFMCGVYVLASIIVIIVNIHLLPQSLKLIFTQAFSKNAFFGGIMGVMVKGITRAAFSNEAGLGSAAIAHAAAKTNEPVREGVVAMLGPFIDTIIICVMTAMVVITTGVWNDPTLADVHGNVGVSITTVAFATVMPWFPYVLTVSIALFAYSTMISWCYYGERGWIYLLDHFNGIGLKTVNVFRIAFVVAVVFGAIKPLKEVLTFTDIMVLSLAFPNIIGGIILAPEVRKLVLDYWGRLKSGQMKPAD
ncbi:MAG: alanine:cation symporter family protein [Candidatus Dadabacteria bacterium]|nr:MAG: alanine:cation symporter family protein [Candidatus Dadabacteria bacterium]